MYDALIKIKGYRRPAMTDILGNMVEGEVHVADVWGCNRPTT